MENRKIKKILANKVFVLIAIIIVGIAGSMTVNTVLVQGSGPRSNGDYAPSLGGSSMEMIITGDTQGAIDGEGRNGVILIDAMVHEVNATYDEITGQASGVRVHSPLTVVKVMDKASPKIAQALCTGEQLQVTLNFNRPNLSDPMAGWDHYYTITLTNAKIVLLKTFDKASPLLYGGDRPTEEVTSSHGTEIDILSYRHMEQVSFVYEEIEWNWMADTIYIDDYYNPVIP